MMMNTRANPKAVSRVSMAILMGVVALSPYARAEEKIDILVHEAGSADAALVAITADEDLKSLQERLEMADRLISEKGASPLRERESDGLSAIIDVLKQKNQLEFASALIRRVHATNDEIGIRLHMQAIEALFRLSDQLAIEAERVRQSRIKALEGALINANTHYQNAVTHERDILKSGYDTENAVKRAILIRKMAGDQVERIATQINGLRNLRFQSDVIADQVVQAEDFQADLVRDLENRSPIFKLGREIQKSSSPDKIIDLRNRMAKAYRAKDEIEFVAQSTAAMNEAARGSFEIIAGSTKALVSSIQSSGIGSDSALLAILDTIAIFESNFAQARNIQK